MEASRITTTFYALFTITNLLILCSILSIILSYALEWLFDIDFSILLLFGILFVLHNIIMYFATPSAIPYLCPQFINFISLYSGRNDANECLQTLRASIAMNPTSKNYSVVSNSSCFAVLNFGPDMEITSNAAANAWFDSLANSIADPYFMGSSHMSYRGGDIYVFAGLHCINSWSGIAMRIAKRHVENSTQEEVVVAPSDTTPLLS